jgi:hypothetical protein
MVRERLLSNHFFICLFTADRLTLSKFFKTKTKEQQWFQHQ